MGAPGDVCRVAVAPSNRCSGDDVLNVLGRPGEGA